MKDKIYRLLYKISTSIPLLAKLVRSLRDKLYRNRAFENKKQVFNENCVSTLFKIKEILDEEDLLFWLDFGTMLGAYREGKIIGHDDDLDLALFVEDYEKFKEVMVKNKFTLRYEYVLKNEIGMEQTYLCDGVNVDFFFYKRKNSNEVYCNTFSHIDGEYHGDKNTEYPVLVKEIYLPIKEFKDTQFYGKNFKIPSNTVDCLRANYGDNFMIPDPNFDYKKMKNIKYYSKNEKKGIFIKYI